VEYICLGKQKVVLFPIFRENNWVAAGNARITIQFPNVILIL